MLGFQLGIRILWGKNKQKRHPRNLKWRFGVRSGLRRFAPFSLPPRAINDRSKSGLCWRRLRIFCTAPPLTKASFRRRGTAQKKRNLNGCAFALVVIRLGFEPKTHSLEGCCSIQLSYRTDPYFFRKWVQRYDFSFKCQNLVWCMCFWMCKSSVFVFAQAVQGSGEWIVDTFYSPK